MKKLLLIMAAFSVLYVAPIYSMNNNVVAQPQRCDVATVAAVTVLTVGMSIGGWLIYNSWYGPIPEVMSGVLACYASGSLLVYIARRTYRGQAWR